VRQLHVVALSEDGRYVLLGTSKNSTEAAFRVPLEGRLTAAVKGELPRPGETVAPVAALTPKDIQARLRAGESPEDIASSAGVPVSRVERFSGPVEGERARIVEAARACVLHRPRRGASAVALGEAVDHHLAETAQLDPGSVSWMARRLEDGSWIVDVTFTVRGRRKQAAWRFSPTSRDIAAVDASSSVLGYVDPEEAGRAPSLTPAAPARRRRRAAARPPRSVAAVAAPKAAKASAPKRRTAATPAAPAARAAAPSRAQVTAPGTRVEAPAARTAAAAKRRPAASAPAPAPVSAAAPSGSARRAAAAPPAAARARPPAAAAPAPEPPAPESPPQLRVVPPPVEERKGRAVVPGWADVLLSTTPPARSSEPDQDADAGLRP
jgi:hypothetical protein